MFTLFAGPNSRLTKPNCKQYEFENESGIFFLKEKCRDEPNSFYMIHKDLCRVSEILRLSVDSVDEFLDLSLKDWQTNTVS